MSQPLGAWLTELGFAPRAFALAALVAAPLLALAWRRLGRRRASGGTRAMVLASLLVLAGAVGALTDRVWARFAPALRVRGGGAHAPVPPPAGHVGLVAWGASTLMGDVFAPALHIPKVVAWSLGGALQGQPLAVDNLAHAGTSLSLGPPRHLHAALDAPARFRPRVVLVMIGHNEAHNRGDLLAGPLTRERETLVAVYRQELTRIVDKALGAGALVVLGVPAGNVWGAPPQRSRFAPERSEATRRAVRSALALAAALLAKQVPAEQAEQREQREQAGRAEQGEQAGRAEQAKQAEQAVQAEQSGQAGQAEQAGRAEQAQTQQEQQGLTGPHRSAGAPAPGAGGAARPAGRAQLAAALRGVVEVRAAAPEFARSHWLEARLLRALGRVAGEQEPSPAAQAALRRAQLRDRGSQRAPPDQNAVVWALCERERVVCVDAAAVWRARCGPLDNALFYDLHHPRACGHLALGEAFAQVIASHVPRTTTRPVPRAPPPRALTPADREPDRLIQAATWWLAQHQELRDERDDAPDPALRDPTAPRTFALSRVRAHLDEAAQLAGGAHDEQSRGDLRRVALLRAAAAAVRGDRARVRQQVQRAGGRASVADIDARWVRRLIEGAL